MNRSVYVRSGLILFAGIVLSLEALNDTVEVLALVQRHLDLSPCAVLIVAGPKTALLPAEVEAIRAYLTVGGSGFFMLEPFVSTGLEPLIRDRGVVLDNTMVIDRASHYWADISAPAVTTYNRHQITRDLPLTFYPGVRSRYRQRPSACQAWR